MIQDVFLSYANHHLGESPEKVNEVFDALKIALKGSNIEIEDLSQREFHEIAKHFIAFVKCSDLTSAQKLLETITPRDVSDRLPPADIVKIAFEGVFGSRDKYDPYGITHTYCTVGGCWWYSDRREVLGEQRFVGPDRLKCFECDQLIFENILNCIVEGQNDKDIPGLSFLMAELEVRSPVYSMRTPGPRYEMRPEDALKKGTGPYYYFGITPMNRFHHAKGWFGEHRGAWGEILLMQIVGYSLKEFLLHGNHRKLKRCPYCRQFFVAKDIKKLYCYSPTCKTEYERRKKQKQREEDPVTYY
jgi:hypothetical protein